MIKVKSLLTLLLLIPSLSFSEVNKENDQSLNNNEDGVVDKYFDKILDFAKAFDEIPTLFPALDRPGWV